nr:hypothetical protein [Chitinophagales bacterium]
MALRLSFFKKLSIWQHVGHGTPFAYIGFLTTYSNIYFYLFSMIETENMADANTAQKGSIRV